MLFPEYCYIGIKSNVRSQTVIEKLPVEIPTSTEGELYTSVYRFSEKIKDLPSLGNLGPDTLCYPDYVLFDFDSKFLDKAWADAKFLCELLEKLECKYELYFSGGKGFHVYLPSGYAGIEPTANVDNIKRFAEKFAGQLTTWDPSIYNKSRVFRVPNSFNLGGKLFKIQITKDISVEETLLAARSPSERDKVALEAVRPNPVLVALYDSVCRPQTPKHVAVEKDPSFGGSMFLRAEEGRRNETAYTVARKLARRGIAFNDAEKVMANVWNKEACDPPLSNTELRKVVENAYSKGVNEFVDETNYSKHVLSIGDSLSATSNRLRTKQTGFLTGYKFIDDYTMGFSPQDLIWVTGRSGNFKSAVLTNILQRGSKIAKKPALYFSMEMGEETLMPRTVQQSQGMTKKEVITKLRGGTPYTDFKQTLEDFEYVKFIYLSNLNTEQILGLLDYHLETYGELSAIGFDYLGLFKGANNNTERTAKQAQELKTVIAKAANCPTFCLTQAKQVYEGREGDIELDRTCAKDSDSVLDLGDYALGLWGYHTQIPGMDKEEKYIFGRWLKSRGMNEEEYGVNPYFGVAIDKPFMRVRDIFHVPNPPTFNQIGKHND